MNDPPEIQVSEEEQFLLTCPSCRKNFFAYFVAKDIPDNPDVKPWVEYRRVEAIE